MKKAKKSPTKARKAAKPAARKSAKPTAKKSGAGTYTPQPIQGMGWAPFRYPLQ